MIPGQYTHFDGYGKTNENAPFPYGLVCIDETTGLITHGGLTNKSGDQTASILLQHISKFPSFTGPRYFKSDNAPEFTSKPVTELITRLNGTQLFSTPYFAQENGSAESAVRVLKWAATAHLLTAGAPPSLSHNAMDMAAALHTVLPHSRHNNLMSPYESATGRKPNIQWTKILPFQLVYIRLQKHEHPTFGAKVVAGAVTGYGINNGYPHGTYQVYIPTIGRYFWRNDIYPQYGKFYYKDIAGTKEDQTLPAEPAKTIPDHPDDSLDLDETPPTPDLELSDAHIGRVVSKDFGVHGIHQGTITGVDTDKQTGLCIWHVTYEDGDEEDWDSEELKSGLLGTNNDVMQEEENMDNDNDLTANLTTYDDEPKVPKTFDEAWNGPDKDKWRPSIIAEWKSLINREVYTWEKKSQTPSTVNLISLKWVFVIKRPDNTGKRRYKSRLVGRGFLQRDGIIDNTAQVCKIETLKLLLLIANERNWDIQSCDVSCAFLFGELEPETQVWSRAPPGTMELGADSDEVMHIKKGLYGLKESNAAWLKLLFCKLRSWGYKQSQVDTCHWMKINDTGCIHLGIWVDDVLAVGDTTLIKDFFTQMETSFDLTIDTNPKDFIGARINYDRTAGVLTWSAQHYVEDILLKSGMQDCQPGKEPYDSGYRLSKKDYPGDEELTQLKLEAKACPNSVNIDTYCSIAGKLNWIVTLGRGDIQFANREFAKAKANVGKRALEMMKQCLRYLQRTKHYCLTFKRNRNNDYLKQTCKFNHPLPLNDTTDYIELSNHSLKDSDYLELSTLIKDRAPPSILLRHLSSKLDPKALIQDLHMGLSPTLIKPPRVTADDIDIIGFTDSDWASDLDSRDTTRCFHIYINGTCILSEVKSLKAKATSTADAEYMAMKYLSQAMMYFRMTLVNFDVYKVSDIEIFCDNTASLQLAHNPVHHSRAKHVDIAYHFTRHLVQQRILRLGYVPSTDNIADIGTKPLHWRSLDELVPKYFGMY